MEGEVRKPSARHNLYGKTTFGKEERQGSLSQRYRCVIATLYAIEEALKRREVRLETFELRKAVEVPKSKAKCAKHSVNEETKSTTFDGTIPRRIVSKDNFDVVWHFPNAIGPRGTVRVS